MDALFGITIIYLLSQRYPLHFSVEQLQREYINTNLPFSAKTSGPLSTLQRALTANVKVTVITRTFKGIRGECTGYLVAYDRFMNLVRKTNKAPETPFIHLCSPL